MKELKKSKRIILKARENTFPHFKMAQSKRQIRNSYFGNEQRKNKI
jgi:hypothetical protein